MKKTIYLQILLLTLIGGLLVTACDPIKTKVSIEGRLASLATHLSSDRTNANADFEVGTAGYSGVDAGIATWPAATITVDTINSSNASAVTATLRSTANITNTVAIGGSSTSTTMTAEMVTNGDGDYVIRHITTDWAGLNY